MPTHRCPQCGAPVSGEVGSAPCPACLMQLGLTAGRNEGLNAAFTPEPGPTQIQYSNRNLPHPADLAASFPELEIIRLVGYGGMGAVYQARQTGLDRFVALKIIMPEVANEAGFAERFTREARVLARLNHPHIVTIHDFGQRQGLHYLIMEFVDGVNLREVLNSGRMQPSQALRIIPPLCAALQYAHDEGVVHRDIKPENILLDHKGRVKIADFGLARLAGEQVEHLSLTGTRQVVGTPRYMAPEQMHGSRAVDHRVDLYSLGVVFYEMLTGEIPVGRFAPPSEHAPLDARLDDVILKALENNPDRRYQTAADMQSDVETISRNFTPVPAQQPVAVNQAVTSDLTLPATFQLFIGGLELVVSIGIACLTLYAMNSSAPILVFGGLLLLGLMGIVAGIAAVGGAMHHLVTGSLRGLRLGATLLLFPVSIVWPVGLMVGVWVLKSAREGVDPPIQRNPLPQPIGTRGSPTATRLTGLAVLHLILGILLLLLPILLYARSPRANASEFGSSDGRRLIMSLITAVMTGLCVAGGAIRYLAGGSLNCLKWNTGFLLLPTGIHCLIGLPAGLWSLLRINPFSRHGTQPQPAEPATRPVLVGPPAAPVPAQSSEHFSVPWSGFGWAQRAVRKIQRQPSSRHGGFVAILLVVLCLSLWYVSDGSLLGAARNGNAIGVRLWLLTGTDLNATDERGMTPLMWACWLRKPEIAQQLLNAGADVNLKGMDGETALMKAAFQGQANIVTMLLTRKASVDESDNDGETALLLATSEGHIGIVQSLLAYQANAMTPSRAGWTPLMAAALKGHVPLVDALLPLSRMDAKDASGETALMKAAGRGQLAVVEQLLQAGADFTAVNQEGSSALAMAIQHGQVPVIELLAQKDNTNSELLALWRGFRNFKTGQAQAALPDLIRISELTTHAAHWKLKLDDWQYEIVDPKVLAWILRSNSYYKLGNIPDAQHALQQALKMVAPGVTSFTLLRRKLERPERIATEEFELTTSDLSWHVTQPGVPWNLSRTFHEEERGPGRTFGNSGRDQRDLKDL